MTEPFDEAVPMAPRRPTTPEVVVYFLVGFAATIDLARKVSVVGVSGLGGESLVAAGLLWAVWLARPVLSNSALRVVLPLVLFNLDAAGTRLWSSTGIDGTQLQVIGLAFLGAMLLSARESAVDAGFPRRLHRVILLASPAAVAMCLYGTATTLPDQDTALVGRRSFALYAMPTVAVAVALWRGTWVRSTARKYLLWAFVLIGTVACTQSRTGLVACLMLLPLGIALRLTRRSLAAAAGWTVAGAVAFGFVVLSYQPLYDRFFANDARINIGGVAINASGRTEIWNLLLSRVGNDWVFGKGIATSIETVRQWRPEIGQPHNDFLRFYFDQGIVGVGLWAWFVVAYFYRAGGDLRRSVRVGSDDYAIQLAGILAFAAAVVSMATDNTYVYGFVMVPLGALMGAGLGAGQALNPDRVLADDGAADYQAPWTPSRPSA